MAQCGHALQHASTKLKNDKEVVLAAVAQHGAALMYALWYLCRALLMLTEPSFHLLSRHAPRPPSSTRHAWPVPVVHPAIWKLERIGEETGHHVQQVIADFAALREGVGGCKSRST